MAKPLEKPDWYPLDIYNENPTLEEWLTEIWKRYEIIESLKTIDSPEQKINLFNKMIISNIHPDYLASIIPQTRRPIKPLSIFEALHIATTILHSEWYKKFNNRRHLEVILTKLAADFDLSNEEFILSRHIAEIPWHIVLEDEKANQKLPFTHGSPVTINNMFCTDDIVTDLRLNLKKSNGHQAPPVISKRIIDEWHKKKILAIFDIQLWYEIHNSQPTKAQLIKILWPDNDKKNRPLSSRKICSGNNTEVSELDSYFDVANKLSKKVISMATIGILQQQLELKMLKDII